MLMRMSTMLVRTLREDPSDADVPSHRWLIRAGYVRRAGPGVYTFLPLGKLVLDNVARIVREEMLAIGGQEVLFPALLPREPYEQSGRWRDYGDDIFRLKDRRGADYLLGPTHEEMFALLVRDIASSHRDFPRILFQVQTKFRDETRPRAGLLRGREFLMKDAYSFDLDDAGLEKSYELHRHAYTRIFERLELQHTVVAAMSGAMGGTASEEFLAAADVGEDTFVGCTVCDYAANTEAVVTVAPPVDDERVHPPLMVLDTPDTPTIDSLVTRLNAIEPSRTWTAADTLKNVVLTVGGELLVIGVPGDREVDLKRVAAAVHPAPVALFEDFASYPALTRGYIGPQALAAAGIRYLVDPRVAHGTAWVTGADEPGKHAINVVAGRDFVPAGTIEAAAVRAGDTCPNCGVGELVMRRGIEIGHIFALGRRFADVFGLDAAGPDGKPIRITMGSYGIGVSRAVAAIAEQHADARGLVWPAEVAPFDVHIVPTGKAGQLEAALELGGRLVARGKRVLVDDRPGLSAGVKFADAELLGMPTTIVVGRRFTEGVVEVRTRRTLDSAEVPIADLVP